MSEKPENPYIFKDDATGQWVRTPLGQEVLEAIVTDADGPVYAFKERALGSTVMAAAMARLSRREGDLRETILVEFPEAIDPEQLNVVRSTPASKQAEVLMNRVVNEYGDDSVKQLGYLGIVTERVSNLATKKIEWGRLAGYLEQSTRYIRFDQKKNGRYKFTPANVALGDVSPVLMRHYETSIEFLFDNYSDVVGNLINNLTETKSNPENIPLGVWNSILRAQACDAARYMLPVATQSTVATVGSDHAIENMILRLRAEDLREMNLLGNATLHEVRKVAPVFFNKTDNPNYGGRASEYYRENIRNVRSIADELLNEAKVESVAPSVDLVAHTATSEDELLVEMLFSSSQSSRAEIASNVGSMSSEDKIKVLSAYIGDRQNRRHRPGRALELPTYSFDVVSDYGIFRDLHRHRIVSGMEWQLLSPFLGYDVPELIVENGLLERYQHSLDESYKLYQEIRSKGLIEEAQYAVLLGHLMRWKFTMNAREAMHLIELRTGKGGHPSYRRVAAKMFEEIARVTPHVAAAISHVDLGGDPELSRLEESIKSMRRLQRLGLE